MRDRVIIPTFDRPEMLALCLERLYACADFTDKVDVHIYVDNHAGRQPIHVNEIVDIAGEYPVHVRIRPRHLFPGNSFNVLCAYQEAWNDRCQHVFEIEDDVLVEPDFFSWQYEQFERNCHAFAVVAGKNLRTPPPAECWNGYYQTTGEDLCSIGVGYSHKTLGRIVPHIHYGYFSDMVGYLHRMFPEQRQRPQFAEQDGLIQRIMLRDAPALAIKRPVVWANPPRAWHVGYYGYHRPHAVRPQGTLTERIAQVREIVADQQRLRDAANSADVEMGSLEGSKR